MPKKHLGVGAQCSVANKYLHPAKVIADRYPNATAHSRVDKLLVVDIGKRMVNKKEQSVINFRHDDFENTAVYCVKRWARIETEGAPEHFFERPQAMLPEDSVVARRAVLDTPVQDIESNIFHAGNCAEDIAMVRNQGLMVDDDNEPAPENIPVPGTVEVDNGGTWGWDGTCKRKITGAVNHRPSINSLTGLLLETVSYVTMFLLFFPRKFIEETIIKQTNLQLEEDMTLGEFLRYLGIWLVITRSSPANMARTEFWSKTDVCRKSGAPFRLNDLMSGRRFDEITKGLSYVSKEAPPYKDPFWEVRDMVQEWNTNMAAAFVPGWILCLDESMSIWTNRWTCPGWVFCPRKPHPIGNEYHTICCGLCGILFKVEMVEGKQRPIELPCDPKTKKTKALLLRLCEGVRGSGRVVILDSGFCVLEGIIELRKMGVYAGALIKKRRYWPKHVPGDLIDDHFKDKEVGSTDAIHGIMDEVHYDFFCMKEPDYVMKIMSTYGGLLVKEGQRVSKRVFKEGNEEKKMEFKYTEPFSNHFDYRHIIDDHNNLRHATPSIEETWRTHRWANRVFAFLFAVTEINIYLAFVNLVWSGEERKKLQEFRSDFAWALIDNQFLNDTEEAGRQKRAKRHVTKCKLESAPPFAKRKIGGKWDKSCKQKYQQYACTTFGCKKKVRTYCVCDVGSWLCQSCFIDHVVNTDK